MGTGLNRAQVLGNLGDKVDLRSTKGGVSVATFSVATNERWKDKAGVEQERVEWHRIEVWKGQAEMCAKYLAKGSKVLVEGRLSTQNWLDAQGVKHYATRIVAESVMFLSDNRNARPTPEDPGRPVRGGDASDPPPAAFGGREEPPPPGDADASF